MNRFKMLTSWLTFTALLAASANPDRAAIGRATPAVAPTRRVKGHPGEELTLNCGDRTNAGEVQYWHTPFGDVQSSGFHSKLDPVFMHPDGSLVVPNSSVLHSGLYYCLLQHTEGATLWPYQLHVGPENQEHPEYRQGDAFRFRRDVGPVEERQAEGVSDGQFAGAVAASVLLTFVLGFSAGALSRTHVLRCLGAVTTRLQSPRKLCPTDTQDHGTEVTATTLPHTYGDQVFEMVQNDDNEADCATTETAIPSTTTSSPNKPQRSFRQKRQEEPGETTAYLEACDHVKDDEEEEEQTEVNKGCDVEAEDGIEFRGFYLLGEDGGSPTGRDGKECSEDAEKKDGREGTEEMKEWRQGEVEEEGENGSKEDGEERKTEGGGEPSFSAGRRRRVIRLYQYDDDGQRYGHLPDPAPDEPGPAPRLKQRSLSLTRLNAIMAAASAGPLDTRETGETGREEREEKPHFHMEI
ncbi:uncharacterized protein LOC118494032 [Sander lucioperca]|uniref:uncharacterized protein LOC118494032 n=1 Tax=Sander lucioperca TaxID=283035 RepID=UPI001653B179|nr:uncharacterized protein LOC118494032 [Sander lucioperca]